MTTSNLDYIIKMTSIILSEEQEQALSAFNSGYNLLLTGPGGSGKTALIKQMVETSKAGGKNIQVCALTGCAAVLLNCQAKTVHSWAGIGLANGPADLVIKRIITNKKKIQNWKKVDILIIDEVSMMSQKIFEILDGIARGVRKQKSHLPFGGIQIVFSGDFYQLPPVSSSLNTSFSTVNNGDGYGYDYDDSTASAFCFESPLWESTITVVVQLKKIFRQTDDVYTNILNRIRVGKLSKSSFDILNRQLNKTMPATFKPTILLPRKKDVEVINMAEMAKLTSNEKKYTLQRVEMLPDELAATYNSSRNISSEQREMEYTYMVNNIMAEKEIILKVGAQVMCIANIDMESAEPLVNGSQGVIVDFVSNGLPLVQFTNGYKRIIQYHTWSSETNASIGVKQVPLIYAWAVTIHKSQGMSLDMAQIDAGSSIFECGQTYVALSRIKSLDGLYLSAFDPQKIKVNKKVQEFYSRLE
jgi:ATP-dependent DNA helicase PIF1